MFTSLWWGYHCEAQNTLLVLLNDVIIPSLDGGQRGPLWVGLLLLLEGDEAIVLLHTDKNC
jgi:hypothetical protein|eukprot:COSAG06_NODE_261_length_18907_cov_6.696353_11_plen_61_part_00